MQSIVFITIKFHLIGICSEFQPVRTILNVDYSIYYDFLSVLSSKSPVKRLNEAGPGREPVHWTMENYLNLIVKFG